MNYGAQVSAAWSRLQAVNTSYFKTVFPKLSGLQTDAGSGGWFCLSGGQVHAHSSVRENGSCASENACAHSPATSAAKFQTTQGLIVVREEGLGTFALNYKLKAQIW